MNLTSNWNINSIGRWTNVLVPAGLTSHQWGIQGPPEPVHFMWEELSPPRWLNRFAWKLWVVAGSTVRVGLLHGLLFHFRSEPQNRKLAFFPRNRLYCCTKFSLESIKTHFKLIGLLSDISGAKNTAYVPHMWLLVLKLTQTSSFHGYFRYHLYRKVTQSTRNGFWSRLEMGNNCAEI